MRRALALLAAALIAGCMAPGTRQAERYFILDAAPGRQAAAAVRVAPTSAASFYDTQDIVYSRAPGTRAYYQFNHWTERPQRAIHEQLAARFGIPKGGVVLNTRLDEIYHDAAERPGTARISLTAELVDPAGRTALARRTFKRSAPAASYDAPGAVQAFRQALGALLDDVVAWADTQASPK
jgi:ABC-type uncharacterized transport system auxiliary subunit